MTMIKIGPPAGPSTECTRNVSPVILDCCNLLLEDIDGRSITANVTTIKKGVWGDRPTKIQKIDVQYVTKKSACAASRNACVCTRARARAPAKTHKRGAPPATVRCLCVCAGARACVRALFPHVFARARSRACSLPIESARARRSALHPGLHAHRANA